MEEKEERKKKRNSCSGQLIGPIGLLKCGRDSIAASVMAAKASYAPAQQRNRGGRRAPNVRAVISNHGPLGWKDSKLGPIMAEAELTSSGKFLLTMGAYCKNNAIFKVDAMCCSTRQTSSSAA